MRWAYPKDVCTHNECHEGTGEKGNPEILAFRTEVYNGDTEAAYGHHLIGPAEIIPEKIKSARIQITPEKNARANSKHGNAENEAILHAFLRHVEKFGESEAEATESGVPARDGENDHADDDDCGNGFEGENGGDERIEHFDSACL